MSSVSPFHTALTKYLRLCYYNMVGESGTNQHY